MTREEAIRILDPETSAEALAEIEYYACFRGKEAKIKAVEDACILAVAALREQEQRRWIPVTERLPQKYGEVCKNVNMLMDDGFVTVGWLNQVTNAGYYLDAKNDYVIREPLSRFTHWMPLPEPPKEG